MRLLAYSRYHLVIAGKSRSAGAAFGMSSTSHIAVAMCCIIGQELTLRRAVELIHREILRQHPEATGVNAVLIDFFLYDLAKEREAAGECVCAV